MKLITLLLLSLATSTSQAFEWTNTDIQALYGGDFELGDNSRTTITVEHADGWKYGSNFFFVDTIFRDDIGVEVYAEAYTYLSLSKISGQQVGFGPIKDISILGGLNISNKPENDNFKAYLAGISFDLGNPWFDYLQLDIATIKNDSQSGKFDLQLTPVWSVPFSIADVKFKFRGFADFWLGNSNASGTFNVLAQPQMLLDIGNLSGWQDNKVYIGVEYMLWHNKFGVENVNESTVQGMIIGFF